jgi:RNA-binding protein YhbY
LTTNPLFSTRAKVPSRNIVCFQTELSNEADELRPRIEKAWRHVKKPLLRIGGKGISDSHGNSLQELLKAHTAVKVKINSTKLGTYEDIFNLLKSVVEKKSDMTGIELIHIRNSENTIMVGLEGTLDNIREGTFPPPPPPKV